MNKVVVVDDEAIQSRGLKNILRQKFQSAEVEAFTNADSALEYIQREKVKIVITDICMPETDGLELTRRIKKIDSGVKIILLTGFADFEYARKAIHLGAFDYLLKPLNPDKINEVLGKAMNDLEDEKRLLEEHDRMKKQLDMTLPVYLEKLLNQWVYGWASEDEVKEIEKIISRKDAGFIIATKLTGLQQWHSALETEKFNNKKSQIILSMRQALGKPYHTLSFFSQILQETMITIVTFERRADELSSCLESRRQQEWLQRFVHEPELEGLRITIGLGEIFPRLINNIEKCYNSAATVLAYGFYFPDVRILKASYILTRRISTINISLAEEELIKDEIRKGNADKAEGALIVILERYTNNGYPEPGHLKTSCENLLRHVALSLHSELRWHADENKPDYVAYDALLRSMRGFLEALTEEVKIRKTGKNTEFVAKFQDYLDRNYKEDISLEDIAEYFQLTPTYFSTLVKKLTGMSFSKSLIIVRINKAKEILRDTNLKIYRIAEETGYRDVKYFNRVFKNETGITPIMYREDLKGMKVG